MKIQLLSDLHKEFFHDASKWDGLGETDADVIVLAGDIWTGTKGVEWAAELSGYLGKSIIYI